MTLLLRGNSVSGTTSKYKIQPNTQNTVDGKEDKGWQWIGLVKHKQILKFANASHFFMNYFCTFLCRGRSLPSFLTFRGFALPSLNLKKTRDWSQSILSRSFTSTNYSGILVNSLNYSSIYVLIKKKLCFHLSDIKKCINRTFLMFHPASSPEGYSITFYTGRLRPRLDFRRLPGPAFDPPRREGMSAGSFSRTAAGNRA